MKATTIGIDLAKAGFQVHGVDEHGKRLFNKQLKRSPIASFFANIPPGLIGMETCVSAHFWANKLQSLGHHVKLMAPQFVKPYVKTNVSVRPVPSGELLLLWTKWFPPKSSGNQNGVHQ